MDPSGALGMFTLALPADRSLPSRTAPWVVQPPDPLFSPPIARIMGAAVWDAQSGSAILLGGKHALRVCSFLHDESRLSPVNG
jgi:hypothetical protein